MSLHVASSPGPFATRARLTNPPPPPVMFFISRMPFKNKRSAAQHGNSNAAKHGASSSSDALEEVEDDGGGVFPLATHPDEYFSSHTPRGGKHAPARCAHHMLTVHRKRRRIFTRPALIDPTRSTRFEVDPPMMSHKYRKSRLREPMRPREKLRMRGGGGAVLDRVSTLSHHPPRRATRATTSTELPEWTRRFAVYRANRRRRVVAASLVARRVGTGGVAWGTSA